MIHPHRAHYDVVLSEEDACENVETFAGSNTETDDSDACTECR